MSTWRRRPDQGTYCHESQNMSRPPRPWMPRADQNTMYSHDQSRFSGTTTWRRVDGRVVTRRTHLQPPRFHNRKFNGALSFEKKFCWEVGRMSWKRFLDAKKYISLYDNIMQWNDLAARDAFLEAKARFSAELRGCHDHFPLPSPDIYIDNIDWNSGIEETEDPDDDPLLSLSDLEAEYGHEVDEGNIIFPESFYIPLDQIKATGWMINN